MGKRRGCSCCDDYYTEGMLRRREVRQDHGGGPEIPPHRKAAKRKPRKARADHKHIYVHEVEVGQGWGDLKYRRHTWQCAEFGCYKMKKVKYEYFYENR